MQAPPVGLLSSRSGGATDMEGSGPRIATGHRFPYPYSVAGAGTMDLHGWAAASG